jgi:hypothetical protein
MDDTLLNGSELYVCWCNNSFSKWANVFWQYFTVCTNKCHTNSIFEGWKSVVFSVIFKVLEANTVNETTSIYDKVQFDIRLLQLSLPSYEYCGCTLQAFPTWSVVVYVLTSLTYTYELEHDVQFTVWQFSVCDYTYIFIIEYYLWRQVQSLFQNNPSTYCDPELPPSNETSLFCTYDHPVASYIFFHVFLSLPSPILSFLQ